MATREALFAASFKDARARPMLVASPDPNSPNCFNIRSAGRMESKAVTLTAHGDPVAVNLFTITGAVKILNVFGIFEDVMNVDDIEEVRLDVYDGTVAVVLSLAAGVICDGAVLGSQIAKVDDSAAALAFLNADQVRINEVTKHVILDPVMVNAKNGGTTYLRMLYKNADEALDCAVRWYVEWRALCGSTGDVSPV